MSANLDQLIWEIRGNTAICRICQDGRARAFKNCQAHENTPAHQSLLEHHQNRQEAAAERDTSEPQIVDDALRNLLSSFTGNSVHPYPARHVPSPDLGISWNLMNELDADIPFTAEEQGVANGFIQWLNSELMKEGDVRFAAHRPLVTSKTSLTATTDDLDSIERITGALMDEEGRRSKWGAQVCVDRRVDHIL
ncbi:hypothetical protein B0H13DRAFT_1856254 [Mycena leptocephala]|nr:hypothetical protein B0H13DRAFT_1856254 [Mycena leptocephala]